MKGRPPVQGQRDGDEGTVAGAKAEPGDESPGLPGFRTWGAVYLVVFVIFVFVVMGLSIFTSLCA